MNRGKSNTPPWPSLVAFTGPAGSGKDTAALVMKKLYASYTQMAFADPLKAMVRAYLRFLTDDEVEIESIVNGILKEKEHEYFMGKSSRQVQQTLGTEWGRNLIDSKFWMNVMDKRVHKAWKSRYRVVVSDLRFPNELE